MRSLDAIPTIGLVSLLTAGAACNLSDNGSPVDAGADVVLTPDTLACLDAGNFCATVEHAGCGAGSIAVGTCGPGFYCCSTNEFFCGDTPCTKGNTCDGTFEGYCSGATSTPNCGAYACVDGCACDGGCACPRCVRSASQSGPNGPYCPGQEKLYVCDPPLALDAGSSEFPTGAGACTVVPGGNICCER